MSTVAQSGVWPYQSIAFTFAPASSSRLRDLQMIAAPVRLTRKMLALTIALISGVTPLPSGELEIRAALDE